jgi:hypothetical protein
VTVVAALGICLLGSVKLFFSATSTSDNAHAAALNGARNAKLAVPGGTGPARTGSASPQPSSSLAAQVSGSLVTAVGDSIMVAATPALDHALPGILINAQVGRQFSTGLQVIASLKASGLLRPIVVVGLGTNGPVSQQEINQLYTEIGPDRELVLVNTYDPRTWQQEVNSILATAVADHPKTVLADWSTTIEYRTDLLWPDGIHPQPGGGVVYAGMLKAALQNLVNQPA